MKTLKRLSVLALALLMCLSLCACGSSTSAANAKEARSESYYAAPAAMPEPAYEMAADYDMAYGNGAMGMTSGSTASGPWRSAFPWSSASWSSRWSCRPC